MAYTQIQCPDRVLEEVPLRDWEDPYRAEEEKEQEHRSVGSQRKEHCGGQERRVKKDSQGRETSQQGEWQKAFIWGHEICQ